MPGPRGDFSFMIGLNHGCERRPGSAPRGLLPPRRRANSRGGWTKAFNVNRLDLAPALTLRQRGGSVEFAHQAAKALVPAGGIPCALPLLAKDADQGQHRPCPVRLHLDAQSGGRLAVHIRQRAAVRGPHIDAAGFGSAKARAGGDCLGG